MPYRKYDFENGVYAAELEEWMLFGDDFTEFEAEFTANDLPEKIGRLAMPPQQQAPYIHLDPTDTYEQLRIEQSIASEEQY